MSASGPRADGMRVLLTGAAGFVGSHVHRALVAAGHEVVAADALLGAVHGFDPVLPEGVSLVDIRDPEALEPLLHGVDVVCHLAAAVPLPDLDPEAMDERPAGASDPLARVSRAVHDRGVEQHSTDGSGPIERAGRQPDPSRIGDGQGQPHGIDDQGRAGVDHGETPSQGHGAGPCVRGSAGERASGIGAQPGLTGMRWAAWYAAHNDAGTAALLAAMEQAGVRRLVMASSVAVYGEGRYRGVRSGPFFPGVRRRTDLDRGLFDHRAPRTGEVLTWEPVREDAPLRPRSAYAASKVAQEHYALAWAASTGSAATVLRYHHVYGEAADSGRLLRSAESGIVARFRADLRAERAPRVFEDGGQVRDFVHVRDVAAATVAAVAHPVAGFVPLNIGSGRPVTLWEVASTMAKAVGGPTPVVTGQYRLTDVRHLVAHHERARHILDFAARIAPAQGLAAYAAAGGRTE